MDGRGTFNLQFHCRPAKIEAFTKIVPAERTGCPEILSRYHRTLSRVLYINAEVKCICPMDIDAGDRSHGVPAGPAWGSDRSKEAMQKDAKKGRARGEGRKRGGGGWSVIASPLCVPVLLVRMNGGTDRVAEGQTVESRSIRAPSATYRVAHPRVPFLVQHPPSILLPTLSLSPRNAVAVTVLPSTSSRLALFLRRLCRL